MPLYIHVYIYICIYLRLSRGHLEKLLNVNNSQLLNANNLKFYINRKSYN